MRIAGGLAPIYLDKVSTDKMNEWLMRQAAEDSGYRHYYTFRKRHIMEGMTCGLTPEQYWINHGRILELQFINALSIKLLKEKKK